MVIRLIILIFISMISLQLPAKINDSAQQYIKNYAFSTCIAQGYKSREVKDDAAAAARGYLEFGDYSLSAYTAARELGKKFLAKNYLSKSGQPMTMAKCLDFFHSSELNDLIMEYRDKQDN